MVKLLKKGEKVYIELPETLKDKSIKAIKLAPDIFVVATDEAIKRLLEKQMYYVMQRRIRSKLISKEGKTKTTKTERGFVILSSDEEARAFSRAHAAAFQRGDYRGVKGFDGRYYVVRTDLYASTLEKIRAALREGGKTADEIAKETGLDKDLVLAVLEIGKEDGIFYEERKGRYRYVG